MMIPTCPGRLRASTKSILKGRRGNTAALDEQCPQHQRSLRRPPTAVSWARLRHTPEEVPMTAVAPTPESAKPATAKDLNAVLVRLKDAARIQGAPAYEARIESLEKLERALLKRKDALAQAIARDFGQRSRHETFVADLFLVL